MSDIAVDGTVNFDVSASQHIAIKSSKGKWLANIPGSGHVAIDRCAT